MMAEEFGGREYFDLITLFAPWIVSVTTSSVKRDLLGAFVRRFRKGVPGGYRKHEPVRPPLSRAYPRPWWGFRQYPDIIHENDITTFHFSDYRVSTISLAFLRCLSQMTMSALKYFA